MKITIGVDVDGKTLKSSKVILDEKTAVQEIAKIIEAYFKDFPGEEEFHIVVQR